MQFLIRTIPAPQNPDAAQARLTALCGVNEFGEPLMRLEWGGNAERFLAGAWRAKYRMPGVKPQVMLVGWAENQGISGQIVKVHPASRKAPTPGQPGNLIQPIIEKHEFTDPFWYLAEWIPPEKMGDTPEQWEARRWQLHNSKKVDLIGPFPERGQYRGLLRFAGPKDEFIPVDDPRVFKTCEALWQLHQQMAATKGYWRDFMRPAEVEQVGRDVLAGILADHADNYAQLRESIASEVAPHAHKILGNPRVFLS